MSYPKPDHPNYCPGSGSYAVTRGHDPCPYCGRHIARQRPLGPRYPHLSYVPRASRSAEHVRSLGMS